MESATQTETLINKETISIATNGHATKRFFMRFKFIWEKIIKNKDINKNQKKVTKRMLGGFSRPPESLKEAEQWMAQLLLQSKEDTAVSQAQKEKALRKYGEETFFFRNGLWQFRVCRDKIDSQKFVLLTTVWLCKIDSK